MKRFERWSELPREDLNMISKMITAGWAVKFSDKDKRFHRVHPYDCPHDPVEFRKGNKHVWKYTRYNEIPAVLCWRVADEEKGVYSNHRSYDTLQEVIENE